MKRIIITAFVLMSTILLSAYTLVPQKDWSHEQEKLHEIAQLARSIGLPEDSAIIREASHLWWVEEVSEDEETRILANVIYNEAPYCTDRHQQLVAQVVINRTMDPRFPDTIREVVNAPGQYDPAYTINLPTAGDEQDEEMQRCFNNAVAALTGQVECPKNVVFQSEFPNLGTGTYETIYVDTGHYQSVTFFNYG